MTKGYRVARTEDLEPTLRRAIADDTVVVIDCPVEYSENMKLTEKLATWSAPSSRGINVHAGRPSPTAPPSIPRVA